jgi:hypothetical protein
MLGQFPVSGENRDLRHAFVEVDAHVYHCPGLLSQRAVRAPQSASLFQAGREANALMASLGGPEEPPRQRPVWAMTIAATERAAQASGDDWLREKQ